MKKILFLMLFAVSATASAYGFYGDVEVFANESKYADPSPSGVNYDTKRDVLAGVEVGYKQDRIAFFARYGVDPQFDTDDRTISIGAKLRFFGN